MGEIKSIESYRRDPINQYDLLGTLKAGVRGLEEPWSFVVDARKWGNETRFIRSGCHPNSVLRVVKVETGSEEREGQGEHHSGEEKVKTGSRSRSSTPFQWTSQRVSSDSNVSTEFVLAIYSLVDISKREEIVLPWDWDDSHLIHLIPSLLSLPTAPPLPTPLANNERGILETLAKKMAVSFDTILGSSVPGGCACEKKRDCALWWACKGASTTVKSLTARNQPGAGGSRPGVGETRNGGGEVEEKEIDREPFKAVLINALNPGVASTNGVNGHGGENTGGWRGRKKGGGQGRKWPELGSLIGFERGWIVKEDYHHPAARPRQQEVALEVGKEVEQEAASEQGEDVDSEEDMSVDGSPRIDQAQEVDVEFDSPLSELADLEPEPPAQVENGAKLELEGLRVAGESLSEPVLSVGSF